MKHTYSDWQKQPFRGVLWKRCSENMQQIYKRTPMPKCDFNKVALQLYWNHTSAWVFSCKFAAYFQNTFSKEHLWMAAPGLGRTKVNLKLTCIFPAENTTPIRRCPKRISVRYMWDLFLEECDNTPHPSKLWCRNSKARYIPLLKLKGQLYERNWFHF